MASIFGLIIPSSRRGSPPSAPIATTADEASILQGGIFMPSNAAILTDNPLTVVIRTTPSSLGLFKGDPSAHMRYFAKLEGPADQKYAWLAPAIERQHPTDAVIVEADQVPWHQDADEAGTIYCMLPDHYFDEKTRDLISVPGPESHEIAYSVNTNGCWRLYGLIKSSENFCPDWIASEIERLAWQKLLEQTTMADLNFYAEKAGSSDEVTSWKFYQKLIVCIMALQNKTINAICALPCLADLRLNPALGDLQIQNMLDLDTKIHFPFESRYPAGQTICTGPVPGDTLLVCQIIGPMSQTTIEWRDEMGLAEGRSDGKRILSYTGPNGWQEGVGKDQAVNTLRIAPDAIVPEEILVDVPTSIELDRAAYVYFEAGSAASREFCRVSPQDLLQIMYEHQRKGTPGSPVVIALGLQHPSQILEHGATALADPMPAGMFWSAAMGRGQGSAYLKMLEQEIGCDLSTRFLASPRIKRQLVVACLVLPPAWRIDPALLKDPRGGLNWMLRHQMIMTDNLPLTAAYSGSAQKHTVRARIIQILTTEQHCRSGPTVGGEVMIQQHPLELCQPGMIVGAKVAHYEKISPACVARPMAYPLSPLAPGVDVWRDHVASLDDTPAWYQPAVDRQLEPHVYPPGDHYEWDPACNFMNLDLCPTSVTIRQSGKRRKQ